MVEVYAESGTASATDFDFARARLTFLPGETLKQVSVSVVPDAEPEEDEAFTMWLANPVNALLSRSAAKGTIVDDHRGPPSQLHVEAATVREGDTGTTMVHVRVRLEPPNALPVRVYFQTEDVTALAHTGDYPKTGGGFGFLPGDTVATIELQVAGDTAFEPDERFAVVLERPSVAARLGTPRAEVTIENDDAPMAPGLVTPAGRTDAAMGPAPGMGFPAGDAGATDGAAPLAARNAGGCAMAGGGAAGSTIFAFALAGALLVGRGLRRHGTRSWPRRSGP